MYVRPFSKTYVTFLLQVNDIALQNHIRTFDFIKQLRVFAIKTLKNRILKVKCVLNKCGKECHGLHFQMFSTT